MSIFLTVPFKDKDIVKALGAKWDFANKKWYIPEGLGVDKFKRWLPPSLAGSSLNNSPDSNSSIHSPLDNLTNDSGNENNAIKLSGLLNKVSDAVRNALPFGQWIIAEIASLRKHANSGHIYIELVEHDDQGRETAKAFAKIWASYASIIKKFEDATGSNLQVGMKIMVLATADFSGQYGFSLSISDINPSWTLGEMEAKKALIRKRLTEEGIINKNKSLVLGDDFYKLLVLSPSGAAGLGDFKAEADKLEFYNLCKFDYHEATFEGVSSSGSISSVLEYLMSKDEILSYDALIFIRGGGASTSLNWLNEYDIAQRICNFPIAVICGIGHERDSTIIDEIANNSRDTPSKCAEFIKTCICQKAIDGLNNFNEIKNQTLSLVESSTLKIERMMNSFSSSAAEILNQGNKVIHTKKIELINYAQNKLEQNLQEVSSLMKEAIGLGPANILSRGYCAVKDENGKPVSNIQNALNSNCLKLTWIDGSIDTKPDKTSYNPSEF